MTDDKPPPCWSFEGLKAAVRDVLLQVVAPIEPQPKSLTWTGPLLTTNQILAGCPNIDDQLGEAHLAYMLERDHDPLSVVISITLQLGYEQGLRKAAENKAEHVDNAIASLELLRSAVARV